MTDKKVKVTLCPPGPQEVFFQEQQFDRQLTAVDPGAYLRGQTNERQAKLPSAYGREVKKNRLKKAKEALEGHENKEEILKVLRGE